ncbi:FxSxx-COOH cyclophane-containing RiPP peptide [Streptomyces fuscigenes]|uniref:FxSxx-COOH cyclophane-containing RiPP peptide n=1 Tax=Streptomyces fuscigenes TaxID=1528880 RepID=UPI001F2CE2F4|nr:FxSxx-COOH cyclophane-containing RiPP peptide [Streptomyces fuscigenes]MCF3965263.1 FxSxx-COOH protein [Streptomyces fuscigenes]
MTDPLSHDTGGRNGARRAATAVGHEQAAPVGALPPLPDLTEIDLETLRTLDHPVLADMVSELRERAARPREMLWGFTNSSDGT